MVPCQVASERDVLRLPHHQWLRAIYKRKAINRVAALMAATESKHKRGWKYHTGKCQAKLDRYPYHQLFRDIPVSRRLVPMSKLDSHGDTPNVLAPQRTRREDQCVVVDLLCTSHKRVPAAFAPMLLDNQPMVDMLETRQP